MKVSVVIPAYNEEKNIERCLKSVFEQDAPADEVLVINNNSIDATKLIAKNAGARVIDEQRQGITLARNRGFNEARFELIARCDADAIVPRDWIKKIKYHFEHEDIDALSGPVAFVDSKVIPPTPTPSKILLKAVGAVTGVKHQMLGTNMSLRKDTWEEIRDRAHTSDKKVHEDLDISMKIVEHGGVIGFDPTLVVYTSARRMEENPKSFFIEYPVRFVKTVVENKEVLKKELFT